MKTLRLSSRIAGRHKVLQTYVYPALVVAVWLVIALVYYLDEEKLPDLIYISLWVAALAYMLHNRGKKLYPLAYDQESLYLQHDGQEEIIPLWQINGIELTNLNGGYRIDFNNNYNTVGQVLFLPSFWYPLNFKKMDAKVAAFEKAVWAAKKRRTTGSDAALLPS